MAKQLDHGSEARMTTHALPAPTADTEWGFRMVIRYGDAIGVQSNAVEKKNKEEQGKARKGKT